MKKFLAAALMMPLAALAQTFPSPTFNSVTLQSPLTPANGGTGIVNSSTITLGGNLATSGANPLTFTTTGSTNVTLPVSGTLLNSTTGATAGANSNITSLTGLTTPLSVSQGGTGVTSSTGSGSNVLSIGPSIANLTATGTLTLPANSVTNSELAQAAANTVQCNASGSAATIANCIGFQLADPATSSFTTTAIYDSSRTAINGFPIAAEFGAGTVGTIQSLVGAIQVPSTSTAVQTVGVAGYARTASNTSNAVGIYGQGTMNPSSGIGNAWGGNVLVTNCPNQSCSATQGVSGNEYGFEIDVNLVTTSGGTAPAGNARGLYINGIMDTTPTGDLSAIVIDHAGSAAWTNGLKFSTGCCTNGVVNSPVATGNSQPSVSTVYQATNSSGTTEQGNQFLDASGNMQIIPGSGALISLNDGASVSQMKVGSSGITATGILASTNSTASTSSSTGAITTAGGLGVSGNINAGGSITGGAGSFTALKGSSLAKVFATNTSGQSIPNNAQTTVTGWTSVRDANSNFVASTGIFTAPASADYLVCTQITIGGTGASNGVLQATIIANGSAWATFNAPVWSSTVTDTTVSGCTETNVSSGQTITVQLLQNSGSAQALSTATKQVFLTIVQIP